MPVLHNRIYNCLIVDDEPLAREVIRRYIQQLPMLAIAGECSNAVEAIVRLKQQPIDLLFLDIQMPKISGIELIKSISSLPKIILTTAFEQYALQAFDLDVTDYLLKPVQFERFLKAVMKALPSNDTAATESSLVTNADPLNEPPFLYFRAERKMMKVYLDKILYIESLKDYIKIRTTDGDVITKYSMAALEAVLPDKRFIRIHRSFIAGIDKVNSFTSEQIEIGGVKLPVGKLYRMQVLKMLQGL
ncbi:LytTR family DNA-binding domain-containing protein [Terrimonas sp. NA20]|uniref:LytTR family DNA-binding domain-containing protein n=1 Tax=Terrimonas ginsenosidimutans TaxID=2908004 RepID=A0ABS9KQI7_9BACT|nr:LytTR family DNA-binding domain-containing protein [Terrimonas ginsenosidimutans]MCG2614589.1 LytTR family DNA-binding domain-containing protein [Terrimonas ginsenosidimutans]